MRTQRKPNPSKSIISAVIGLCNDIADRASREKELIMYDENYTMLALGYAVGARTEDGHDYVIARDTNYHCVLIPADQKTVESIKSGVEPFICATIVVDGNVQLFATIPLLELLEDSDQLRAWNVNEAWLMSVIERARDSFAEIAAYMFDRSNRVLH